MAKRYKEKDKKKVNKSKIILFCIVLIIIICIVFFWNGSSNQNSPDDITETMTGNAELEDELLETATEEIKKDNTTLSSDLLNPEEICNEIEIISNDKIGEGYIVKINYQLKNLEEGKVFLYYKLEDNNVVLIEVDIASKQIQSIENYDGNDLAEKLEIKENLKTDVKEYYEENQSGLLDDEYRVNILITNTDIISNIIVV